MWTQNPGLLTVHQSNGKKSAPAKPRRFLVHMRNNAWNRVPMPTCPLSEPDSETAPYPTPEPGSAIALTTSPANRTGAPTSSAWPSITRIGLSSPPPRNRFKSTAGRCGLLSAGISSLASCGDRTPARAKRVLYLTKGHFCVLTNPSPLVVIHVRGSGRDGNLESFCLVEWQVRGSTPKVSRAHMLACSSRQSRVDSSIR